MPVETKPGWAGWFRAKGGQAAGRITGAILRTTTGVVRRVMEVYTGTRIESYIAQKLSQFLDVKIDIKSTGPIKGVFEDVKLQPLVRPPRGEALIDHLRQVQQLVWEATEGQLIIDLDHTTIKRVNLSIDVNAMITGGGDDADEILEFCPVTDDPDDPCLLRAGIDKFKLSAPGVEISLHGFRLEVHHTSSGQRAPPKICTDPKTSSNSPVKPDEAESDGAPAEQAESGDGIRTPRDSVIGEKDPLKDLDNTPGFAAHVLSEWIIRGAKLELKGLDFIGSASSAQIRCDLLCCSQHHVKDGVTKGCAAGIKVFGKDGVPYRELHVRCLLLLSHSTTFVGCRLQHESFFGVTRQRYEVTLLI